MCRAVIAELVSVLCFRGSTCTACRPLIVYSHFSSTDLYQMQYLVQTSGVCMQVASKHNRNPGLNWLKEKRLYFFMWVWSTPQWCSRPQHSFSLVTFSFPLSPPLVLFNLSFLPFSPSNWALNSIFWKYGFCTSPFPPSLDHPTSATSLCSWEKEALGG